MSETAPVDPTPSHGNQPVILGIDEAGRGPVLGPMVYTAAFCLKSDQTELKKLGANDSKQLTEEQRDNLRRKIDDAPFLHYKTRVLSASELSEKMLRAKKYNLNLISHDTAFELVEQVLSDGWNVAEIYVDTVGHPEKYASRFRERFPQVANVVVEKKADANYRIVAAASIVAKTTRDHHIRSWVFPEVERSVTYMDCDDNLPVTFPSQTGSGYPSDPATKNWIENSYDHLFGFPNFVRFSWGTAKVIMDRCAVVVDWEADVDAEEEDAKSAKKPQVKTKDIKSFFAPKSSNNSNKRRKTTRTLRPMPKLLASMSLRRATTLM